MLNSRSDILLHTDKLTLSSKIFSDPIPAVLDFNKFNVYQLIGEGSSASVWLGTYSNQFVAFKVFDPDDESFDLSMMIEEAKVMTTLNNSPYIVKSFGYCLHLEFPSIVMEVMDGSLFDFLKEKKKIGWDTCIQLAFEVSSGLRDLHEENYVHSDIKSHNILLKNGYSKICDFGETAKEGKTKSGVGTPHWMAPEIAKGRENTKMSDVYSFGMLLLELTLGHDKQNITSFENLIQDIDSFKYMTMMCVGKNKRNRK